MKRRFLPLIAAAVGLALVAGCAPQEEAPSDDPSAVVLPTIKPGELKVAFRSDQEPQSFIKDGKPAGLYIEIMEAVAEELGLELTFVSTDFASMVPGVQNHLYDTAAFGVLVTEERQAVVDFTTPIGYGQAQLISLASAPLEVVDDAAGLQIAITSGSALIPLLQTEVPDVIIREFPNITASVIALESAQVAGMFTGQNQVGPILAEHPDFVASQTITSGMNAMPVAKDRTELLEAINAALATIMADGTFTEIFARWNDPTIGIPEDMFDDYPGLEQRPDLR